MSSGLANPAAPFSNIIASGNARRRLVSRAMRTKRSLGSPDMKTDASEIQLVLLFQARSTGRGNNKTARALPYKRLANGSPLQPAVCA